MKFHSERFATILFCSALTPALLDAQLLPDTTADSVYGQGTFTSVTANRGQANPSDNTLSGVRGLATDASGGLYVADTGNNRVLYFPPGTQVPTRVYGQADSFATGTPNKGGIGAAALNAPTGVAADATGIYVADAANHRVLHFPGTSTVPDRVYGQGGVFTSNVSNVGGVTQTALSFPYGVLVDSVGGLYIADSGNNRVLHFPVGGIVADRVYGQANNFSTATPNPGGVSANSLAAPTGLALDPSNGLYVADRDNNRVLHFPSGNIIADRVLGQGSLFSSNAVNLGGTVNAPTNESLFLPAQVVSDGLGGVFVADTSNSRVVHFPGASSFADRVYGQLGAFNTNVPNKGGSPTADGMSTPNGIALDLTGALYVSELLNNRVLRFDAPPQSAISITSITTNPNPPIAGTPFAFNIIGTNINPALAQVDITGPGCAPCVVLNIALSSKTSTGVAGSITLQSAGAYAVTVRNGTLAPSAALALTVNAAGGGGTGGGGTGGGGTATTTGTILSHIADSAGWITGITLINLDTVPADYTLNFYGSVATGTQSLAMSLPIDGQTLKLPTATGTIPVGGSRTIQTLGTDPSLNMGWAELTTTKKIAGFGVFRDTSAKQEASVSLTPAVAAFLLPFDNTIGRVTSYAIVNRNSTTAINVTATVRGEDGASLSSTPITISLPLRGHFASIATDQFPTAANRRGLIEFRTTNADISGLGFRFDPTPATAGAPRAFTSFAVQPIN